MKRKSIFALTSTAVIAFTTAMSVWADDKSAVIFYTNDAHCNIDGELGYPALSALKQVELDVGNKVVLVDAGDAVQGAPVGSLSDGEYIVDIMNYVGYDMAIPGNHEFDYGMDQLMKLADMADYPYICENLVSLEDNKTVFEPYYMTEFGDTTLAFVGVCTPFTYTSSTPAYFQNDKGEYIYSFNGGDAFYNSVQNAIDSAKADGADMVIAVTHLGVGEALSPYTSTEMIENVSGLDAVIDGHSHSVIEEQICKDKDGEDVVLTSTGSKFENIGRMEITPEGEIDTYLVSSIDLSIAEESVKEAYNKTSAYIESIKASYNEKLEQVVAKTEVDLTTLDPDIVPTEHVSNRRIRSGETNLGDFCADAYRILTDADIAFVNGGGIRADIKAGDVTYGDIINVHPFGNLICTSKVTGQQIKDALELGAMDYPGESGGFIQVSGLTYEIDSSVPSSVVLDEYGGFSEVEGEYRVKNIMVGSEPLDLNKSYILAGHNYMLKQQGSGFTMFSSEDIVKDEIYVDSEILIRYASEVLGGVIGEGYENPQGSGRIIIDGEGKTSEDTTTEAVTERGSGSSSSKAEVTTEAATEDTTEVKDDALKVKVTIGSKSVIINDNSFAIDIAPYIQNTSSSAMVPLRFTSLAVSGGNVENADSSENVIWDANTKTATINANGKAVSFTAGSNQMIVDGESITMENNVVAEITEGRMFIPFRALGAALDVDVDWDADTKTAIYN